MRYAAALSALRHEEPEALGRVELGRAA